MEQKIKTLRNILNGVDIIRQAGVYRYECYLSRNLFPEAIMEKEFTEFLKGF